MRPARRRRDRAAVGVRRLIFSRLINSGQWCLLMTRLASAFLPTSREDSHEHCIYRRRGPHGRRTQSRTAVRMASGRSRGQGPRCADRAHQSRPCACRRRRHGLRRSGRRAIAERRAQCGAVLEAAGKRSGNIRRPAVRLVAAGDPFRSAGGDVGRDGRRHRRRRRKHEPRADGAVDAVAGEERLRRTDRRRTWARAIRACSSASSSAPR